MKMFMLVAAFVVVSCGGGNGKEGPDTGTAGADTVSDLRDTADHSAAVGTTGYVCTPCGCRADNEVHSVPGNCPACGMPLVDRATTLTVEAIPQFKQLTDSIWTGGQPTLGQFVMLKDAGVLTVINLRMPEEHSGETEAALVRKLGMEYINIPVDYRDPKNSEVSDFLAATDTQTTKRRVFIHCAAAIRVGAFWMIRRVVRDGWPYDKALEEANMIGLQNHRSWVDFATTSIDFQRGEER